MLTNPLTSIDGHFGFTVQKRIVDEMEKDFTKVAERLGWRVDRKWLNYNDLTFEDHASVGHLPSLGKFFKPQLDWEIDPKHFPWREVGCVGLLRRLFSRVKTCGL